MSSYEKAPPLPGANFPVGLAVVWLLAVLVRHERTRQAGLGAVCGSVWSGESVVLADHNLATR